MKMSTKELAMGAIMLALATVLSIFTPFKMPLGGSITIASMAPILLFCFFSKPPVAFIVSSVYGLIQTGLSIANVMGWGLTVNTLLGTVFLDYILAYAVLGIVSLFGTKKTYPRFILGAVTAVFVRFLLHFFSGIILFRNWATFDPPELYSLVYNGQFLSVDFGIALAVALAVFYVFKKAYYETSIA